MSETTAEPTETKPEGEEKPPEQSFTQADVDRIVRERVKRERDKFADYDDLKTRAGEKATLEDRVAQIERQATESEHRATRAEVANAKGLTPNQAKRLVGSTREELEADADELLKEFAESESERKKRGSRVPTEGKTTPTPGADDERAFVRDLFGQANVD